MNPHAIELKNPPADVWEINHRLDFNEALAPDDERRVETSAARGEFTFEPLYRALSVDSDGWTLHSPPSRAYLLFCGHRGCGKSTELRRLRQQLDQPGLFSVVLLDVATSLDPNNVQYQDVLLALAKELLRRLEKEQIEIDDVYLSRLHSWFDERVVKHDKTKDFGAEIKAGASGQGGVPFLSKIFAELTTAFRVNSTYKEELRRVVRAHFSDFAEAFNQLIAAAEQACEQRGLGKRIFFVVDSTDRMRGDDAKSFFIEDVYQLQLVQALFLYSTPIHLLYQGTSLKEDFTRTVKLPMIKLAEQDGSASELGLATMREVLLRRAPIQFFDDPATVEFLVEHSGGHLRDLLRLLQYTFHHARGDVFDRAAAEKAVEELATDYRRFLQTSDYQLLRSIDEDDSQEHNSERAQDLLFNLALLEYNAYWWRSHPVIRTLDAYQRADASRE